MLQHFPAQVKIILSFLLVFAFLLALQEDSSAQDNTAKKAQILSVSSKDMGKHTEISIKGSQTLISHVYELPQPQRIVIDVSDAMLSPDLTKDFKAKAAINFTTQEVAGAGTPTTRLELSFQDQKPFVYNVSQRNDEIILLVNHENTPNQDAANQDLAAKAQAQQPPPFPFSGDGQARHASDVLAMGSQDQIANFISDKKAIDSHLPDLKAITSSSSQQMQEDFNFSGYQRDKISVEFQKMDLHNVFNFLRQVSGVNIVVDESVQGALTLVLDDVPWDFALDIILNLKELEKEERFNTLVIYPKGKGFRWPSQEGRAEVSIVPDIQIMKKEGLTLERIDNLPLTVVEAQQKMAIASQAEEQEDFETAITLYEQALEKWPKNDKLANRIASIYLVYLNQNAKSLHFAQQALAVSKNKNADAALNAAIASANMQDKAQALKYFNQSINTKKPSKEALFSYASFSEQQGEFNGAIKLLEKRDNLYGKDLDSMIAIARIYDKIGDKTRANERYRAVLSSGFQISPDLVNFIHSRVGTKSTI